MWKQCPHCGEYSFGNFELMLLSYFSTQQCKNCGKLVRNDGLRQFLLFPATMGAAGVGYLIVSVLPEWLVPIGLVMMVGFMLATSIIVPKPVKAEYREINTIPFDPDPGNDKVIVVKGWSEEKLREILEGFQAQRDSEGPDYEIEFHQLRDGDYRLAFPKDIHPSEFAALVNYLQYPIEVGLPDNAISATGRMTLSATFDGIPKRLIGQKAILYIPEKDEDHDVVYVQTESGLSYSYSFQDCSWRQVEGARLSGEVNRLRANL